MRERDFNIVRQETKMNPDRSKDYSQKYSRISMFSGQTVDWRGGRGDGKILHLTSIPRKTRGKSRPSEKERIAKKDPETCSRK